MPLAENRHRTPKEPLRTLCHGCLEPDSGPSRAGRRFLGAAIPERLQPQDVERPGEVVGQRHQAPLAPHLGQAPHQEVVPAGPAFQRAERVLHQGAALAHHAGVGLHAPPVGLPQRVVLVAPDLAVGGLGGDAAIPQRTTAAIRLRTDIALDRAAVLGSGLAAALEAAINDWIASRL